MTVHKRVHKKEPEIQEAPDEESEDDNDVELDRVDEEDEAGFEPFVFLEHDVCINKFAFKITFNPLYNTFRLFISIDTNKKFL